MPYRGLSGGGSANTRGGVCRDWSRDHSDNFEPVGNGGDAEPVENGGDVEPVKKDEEMEPVEKGEDSEPELELTNLSKFRIQHNFEIRSTLDTTLQMFLFHVN